MFFKPKHIPKIRFFETFKLTALNAEVMTSKKVNTFGVFNFKKNVIFETLEVAEFSGGPWNIEMVNSFFPKKIK